MLRLLIVCDRCGHSIPATRETLPVGWYRISDLFTVNARAPLPGKDPVAEEVQLIGDSHYCSKGCLTAAVEASDDGDQR